MRLRCLPTWPCKLPLDFLTSGGFTRTELYSNGTITLPEDTPLQLAAGSSLSMRANRMDLLSGISNPGGTLNFTADATASIAGATRARAGVQVGDGVTFDLRGTWTNDSLLPASAQPTDRVYRDGGSVSLRLDRSLEVASSAAELVVGADAQFPRRWRRLGALEWRVDRRQGWAGCRCWPMLPAPRCNWTPASRCRASGWRAPQVAASPWLRVAWRSPRLPAAGTTRDGSTSPAPAS